MMESTTVAILAGTAANAVVTLGGLALWLAYRTRRIERVERVERPQRLLEPIEARLAELTRAVEVVTVEVERIAEAQRYLMRQGQQSGMPPRLEPPSAGPTPRTVTPH